MYMCLFHKWKHEDDIAKEIEEIIKENLDAPYYEIGVVTCKKCKKRVFEVYAKGNQPK